MQKLPKNKSDNNIPVVDEADTDIPMNDEQADQNNAWTRGAADCLQNFPAFWNLRVLTHQWKNFPVKFILQMRMVLTQRQNFPALWNLRVLTQQRKIFPDGSVLLI